WASSGFTRVFNALWRNRGAAVQVARSLPDVAFAPSGLPGPYRKIFPSGRLNAAITTPAKAATAAIITKKYILSMLLQKLPSQPLMKLPTKLVPSHSPIIIDTMRAGAAFETSESPTGER